MLHFKAIFQKVTWILDKVNQPLNSKAVCVVITSFSHYILLLHLQNVIFTTKSSQNSQEFLKILAILVTFYKTFSESLCKSSQQSQDSLVSLYKSMRFHSNSTIFLQKSSRFSENLDDFKIHFLFQTQHFHFSLGVVTITITKHNKNNNNNNNNE